MNKIDKEKVAARKPTTEAMTPVRLKQETYKKLSSMLEKVNQKDFGKKVRADDVILLSLNLLGSEHLDTLKEESLTNTDRMEMMFREYKAKHKSATKDMFYGAIISGAIGSTSESKTTPVTSKKPMHVVGATV